jgi:hypothetical protein
VGVFVLNETPRFTGAGAIDAGEGRGAEATAVFGDDASAAEGLAG